MLNISKIIRIVAVLFLILIPMQNIFALQQYDKLWASIYIQKPLSADKKWEYSIYNSYRFIDTRHHWQDVLVQGALGYNYAEQQSAWLGYRWTGVYPNNRFSQVNTLFQQLVWGMMDASQNKVSLRSRLEEFLPNKENQIAIRLRERFFIEFPYEYFGKINPVIYDEVFFQLNKTNYTPHQLVSQNRLFLGFNLFMTKTSFWEIGYLNQYLFSTPLRKQNQMDHVLSITYMAI